KVFIAALCADAERPWATFSRGDQISYRDLAKLLRPFGITSRTVHSEGGASVKGYQTSGLRIPPSPITTLSQASVAERPVALPPVNEEARAMLQNLSEEIRECLRRAEECKRLSKTATSPSAIEDYLNMEHRWLTLARSYEFAERLSRFTEQPKKHWTGMGNSTEYHLIDVATGLSHGGFRSLEAARRYACGENLI